MTSTGKHWKGIQEQTQKAERQVHELKEKFAEVEAKLGQFETQRKITEAAIKSIADGLVVVNQKGEVLLMNAAAEKLFGVTQQEKAGKLLLEGIPDEMAVSLIREFGDKKQKVIELTSPGKGASKILRSSSAVIQDGDGRMIGMARILTDVAKQRELEEIKTKFVSNITHELRTPLVAMQKALEIITSGTAGPFNEDQRNFLDILTRNMKQLKLLVEDILDIAKVDSGRVKIRFALHSLSKVIHEACETFGVWAKSKGLRVISRAPENFPEIECDADKVTQVLNNLIGNAIKFTPTGGTITVECAWQVPDRLVRVTVSDTGIGISKENVGKLFGRFEQFGDQEGIEGTGLGLSIAREFVARHRGEISVESEVGKGSVFAFTLPTRQTYKG